MGAARRGFPAHDAAIGLERAATVADGHATAGPHPDPFLAGPDGAREFSAAPVLSEDGERAPPPPDASARPALDPLLQTVPAPLAMPGRTDPMPEHRPSPPHQALPAPSPAGIAASAEPSPIRITVLGQQTHFAPVRSWTPPETPLGGADNFRDLEGVSRRIPAAGLVPTEGDRTGHGVMGAGPGGKGALEATPFAHPILERERTMDRSSPGAVAPSSALPGIMMPASSPPRSLRSIGASGDAPTSPSSSAQSQPASPLYVDPAPQESARLMAEGDTPARVRLPESDRASALPAARGPEPVEAGAEADRIDPRRLDRDVPIRGASEMPSAAGAEKAGETGAVLPTIDAAATPPGLPAQSLDQLARAIGSEAAELRRTPPPGEGHMPRAGQPLRLLDIELNPTDLGTITLRLRVSGDGLEVKLHAHDPATARMLRLDQNRLADLLRAEGPAEVSVVDAADFGAGWMRFDAPPRLSIGSAQDPRPMSDQRQDRGSEEGASEGSRDDDTPSDRGARDRRNDRG
ncbi:flagellar hook-length control protein FliK [Aquabacter spiritensis]|nr:flagellar hook-length control protein FliK [Aquabacter spiritensis]